MKKVFFYCESGMTIIMMVVVCVLFVSCEQLTLEETKVVTVEKQRNQRLVQLNSAESEVNLLILPEAYSRDQMEDFIAATYKLYYSELQETTPYSTMGVWYAAGYPSELEDRIVFVEDSSVVNAVNAAGLQAKNTIAIILVNKTEKIEYCSKYNGISPSIVVASAKDDDFPMTVVRELESVLPINPE